MEQIHFKSQDGTIYAYDIGDQDDLIKQAKKNKWKQVDKPESVLDESDNIKHIRYLRDTDWYVIRKLETGKDIPKEIVDARELARSSIK